MMCYSIALEGMEAFEEQECLRIRMTGGIALKHRGKVRPDRLADGRIGDERLLENLANLHRGQVFAADLLGEEVRQRLLEALVLQDCGVGEARKLPLALSQLFRLLA